MTQRYYSNIYWHFTGSPKGIDWREVRCPSDITKQGQILSTDDATETLLKILDSRVLRSTCTERVVEGIETDKFCCVTDIPVKDLPSHAPYYGKAAIGFRSKAIHKSFIPVLYIPSESFPFIEKLVPNRTLVKLAHATMAHSGAFQEQLGQRMLSQASVYKEAIKEPDVDQINGFLTNFLKITNFSESPENTFYREREWRNIGDFSFSPEDIAAIVVPESHMPEIRSRIYELKYPESISVLAWEFIEGA